MPKSSMAASFVETAAKCRGTAASPSADASQARTLRAFEIVSCVVKVLEQTMTSVRAGSSAGARSANCVPSTLDTKWQRRSPASYGASAPVAITGPRSLPPIPTFTTSVKRPPSAPVRRPTCTSRTKSAH
jgi:hypothetical protein